MQHTINSERLDNRLFRDILLDLVPGIPAASTSSLTSGSEVRNYDIGELIISEGEPSDGIHLLISGTVQTSISKSGLGTKQVSLHQISAPAVLGLTGTMLAQPSAVSISALTATEAAFISRAQFLRVLGQFPQAGLAFSQVIAGELAHTYSHLSQLRGSARLASASTQFS
jgi:CRP-like cAMP-binding protein